MKKILFSTLGIVVITMASMVFYTFPRSLSETLKGVEYQTGALQRPLKHVSIVVNGKLHHVLFGDTTFHGTIGIFGASERNPNNARQLTIHFDKRGYGIIDYGYFAHGRPIVDKAYGSIFINRSFTEVTILELIPNGGWSSSDGLTLSAPANSRKQALSISNALMKKWLRKPLH